MFTRLQFESLKNFIYMQVTRTAFSFYTFLAEHEWAVTTRIIRLKNILRLLVKKNIYFNLAKERLTKFFS